MRALVLLLASLLWFGQPAGAQQAEIKSVIDAQIEAFGRDDFATAFTYASPMIRSMFGTPDNFGRMVRQGYPMVWRPAEVRYLNLRREDGRLWQRVMFTDGAGNIHLFDYDMVEIGGAWKINGVYRVRGPAPAA